MCQAYASEARWVDAFRDTKRAECKKGRHRIAESPQFKLEFGRWVAEAKCPECYETVRLTIEQPYYVFYP